MKEALAIYEYNNSWGESDLYAICLDVDRGYEIVKELNKPNDEESKIQEMCCKCYGESGEDAELNPYSLRSVCNRASIKIDRNGEYCENELVNQHDMHTSHYSYTKIKIIE